ncbi:hypothetical protein [Microbispora triticiradicis]|uniref:Uncharacterized protein n=2 Tax=Microbispora TaxID=2005 RepID=A0ABY3LXE2_9ACTN|nr:MULTISPECIES: hypothetical protein [Microbispora]TLP55643.1 hypothetical protein FED44_24665 [Microbispora fusca]TYB57986.1 hypothetical protein FXF59_17690 [Microbispora tritici]
MRKGLRLALATATGAAVLAAGAAITTVTPAYAAAAVADIKIDTTVSFIPPTGSDSIPFVVKVNDPYVGSKAPDIKAEFWKEGEATTSAGHAASVTALSDLANTTPAPTPASSVDVKGSIPVSSSDKPTTATGKWTLKVTVDPEGSASPVSRTETFEVKAATRVTSANVDPDPVYLKSGKEVDVYAAFHLEKFGDEKITDVRLESKDSDDYYSLTTGLEADDSYHDSTSMDYSTSTGSWQLRISISRATKKYSFTKAFEVRKSGSSKAKSKITLYASPSKVKKGKATKLYGKVYRGSKAWSKKILKLYFKKKGTKKWKFVGYVGATSTGKYTKSVKPKYDGYWRTTAAATSLTYGSLSNIKFVDVK